MPNVKSPPIHTPLFTSTLKKGVPLPPPVTATPLVFPPQSARFACQA